MLAIIFFACLDLEKKSSFMDRHYLSFEPFYPTLRGVGSMSRRLRPYLMSLG